MSALVIDWIGGSAVDPFQARVTIPYDYDNVTLVGGSPPNGVIELDTIAFWNDLKALEASEEGIPFGDLQTHNSAYTIAGTTYADAVALLCEVKFEDTSQEYSVVLAGSNNDIFDVVGGVLVPTPLVTVISGNSAGLVITDISGLTAEEAERLHDVWTRMFGGRLFIDPATGKEVILDENDAAFSEALIFSDDGVTAYDGTAGIARRDKHIKP